MGSSSATGRPSAPNRPRLPVKPEFHEDYRSPRTDPLDGRTDGFDWPSLEALAGEAEARDSTTPDFALLAETLNRLFAWLVEGRSHSLRHLDRTIGRRAIAMIWVVRPDLIEGTPSLAQLAEQLGETRAGLSLYAADFTRTFGLANRGQVHGWNRKRGRLTHWSGNTNAPMRKARK